MNLPIRTAFDKVLRGKDLNIANKLEYDEYPRCLA